MPACALVAAALLIGVAVGIGLGKRLLAWDLTLGADLPGRTPHKLAGKWYYVVPEAEWNRVTSAAAFTPTRWPERGEGGW